MILSIKNAQDFLGDNWQLDETPSATVDGIYFRLSTKFLVEGEIGPKTIAEKILSALESCPLLAQRLAEIETVKGAFRAYMAESEAKIKELERYKNYYDLHKELLVAKDQT